MCVLTVACLPPLWFVCSPCVLQLLLLDSPRVEPVQRPPRVLARQRDGRKES